jgi:predicted  nucleic acid-binding Zn-ribbon protein
MVGKRNIEDQIQELKDAGNQTRMEDAEAELKTLFSEMKKGEEKLDSLFNKQEQIAGEIPDIQKKITDTKAEIKKMKFKISEIVQWSAREKGIPEVRVKDMIFADTTINGFYSSLKLKQDYKCVLIKEYIKQRVKDGSQLNTNPERSGSKISVRPLV